MVDHCCWWLLIITVDRLLMVNRWCCFLRLIGSHYSYWQCENWSCLTILSVFGRHSSIEFGAACMWVWQKHDTADWPENLMSGFKHPFWEVSADPSPIWQSVAVVTWWVQPPLSLKMISCRQFWSIKVNSNVARHRCCWWPCCRAVGDTFVAGWCCPGSHSRWWWQKPCEESPGARGNGRWKIDPVLLIQVELSTVDH